MKAPGRSRLAVAFLAFALLLPAVCLPASVSVTDDRGMRVTLAGPARRVVALAPHLAELAHAAGLPLVGVSAWSREPPELARLPVISDSSHVDFEQIAVLKPDLVLGWGSGNRARDLVRLQSRGLPLFVTDIRRLDDIPRVLRAFGGLGPDAARAVAEARSFESGVRELRVRHAGLPRISVFYAIWPRPLLTLGGQHLVTELLSLCGADNAFGDLAMLTPAVSREQLLARDPDAMVLAFSAEESGARAWRPPQAMRAVRTRRVAEVDGALAHRMGPGVLASASALCDAVARVRAAPPL